MYYRHVNRISLLSLLLLLFLQVIVNGESIRERRTRLRDNEDEIMNVPDEQILEDLLPCTLVEDCPQRNCKEAQCDAKKGICVYNEYKCPGASADDQCTIVLGCDASTNICRYDLLECNDLNDCTEDICLRDLKTDVPYCVHNEKNDCTTYNAHAVQFRVENARHLDVATSSSTNGVTFCHTSTITDPSQSSVLIGFSPYDDCTLASRGTCDNRMSGYNRPEMAQIQEDVKEVSSSINYVSSTLYWSHQSSISVTSGYTLNTHVFGFMQDSINEGFRLRVDILFAQDGTMITGTVMAAPGSQYDGLVFSVATAVLDIGYAANLMNSESGFRLEFIAHLVNQAHDTGLTIINSDESGVFKGDLRGNLVIIPAKIVNYCDLLESDNVQHSLWTETYDADLSVIKYCTTMSLEELLRCRTSDDRHGALFETSVRDDEDVTIIEGALYHSILQRPAFSSGKCNDACAIKQTTSTVYNVTIMSNGTHVMHAYIDHVDFDLQVKWLGNEWLCCTEEDVGDLRINFETNIVMGNRPRYLTNARVDSATEMGVPMSFEMAESNEGRWSIRTYGQGRRIDFLGEHRLLWDVVEEKSVIGHVAAIINVNARHVGSQDHLAAGEKIDADISLYIDRFFTQPFIDRMMDGTRVYASVCLNTNRHLDLLIDQVFVCYSDYTIRSCDDANVKSVQLYSRTLAEASSLIHDFEFVRNPPSTSHCEGFTFLTRGYTKHNQLLHVVWSTQEYGGDGGVISMYSDDDDDNDHDHWSHSDTHEFHAQCPHSWSFDWNAGHCNEWQGGNEAVGWAFLIFFILVILLFSCGCTNAWGFKNERAIAQRPLPSPPLPSPQTRFNDETYRDQPISSRIRQVRSQKLSPFTNV